MKILIVETVGVMLDLVMELEQEGHQVYWYIKRKRERDVGDGLVDTEKLDKWSPRVREADLIIFGDSVFGQSAVSLKRQGKLVIGGSPGTDRLASDDVFMTQTAESLGIRVKEGLGLHLCVGAFFNGYRWVKPVFHGWKFRGFLDEGRGPLITMGVVGKWVGRSKLFNQILKKFEVFLRANAYTGYIEAACIIEQGRPYLCGLVTSLAGPTSLLLNGLQREPWGNFFKRLAEGAVKQVKVMSRYGVGVRIFTFPAPVMGVTDIFKGTPVQFDEDLAHIRLAQVQKIGEHFTTAGTSGFLCMPVGHAMTLETAKERAYKTLESVHVPNIMYRLDIGSTSELEMDKLRKWGYA